MPSSTANERAWSEYLARQWGGECEVVCHDGSRCDIVTDTHAWEVEWAKKWKESIGQSLLYATLLGREPAVALLVRDKPTTERYVMRCAVACAAARVMLKIVMTQ